ncbi:MAG TPA: glycogen debranching protein GlgX [Puia sp.]|nr:glycogen debranching protein GlgX [Puia sp.]
MNTRGRGKYDQPGASGQSYPLGPTLYPGGVNFSLFCKHGTEVDLLFFDHPDDVKPSRELFLNSMYNRSYHYWHVFVEGVGAGQLYGYRINGPFNPARGQRYDAGKLLLDPYAKAVAVPKGFNREDASKRGSTAAPPMKSVVADLSAYDWAGDQHLRRPFSKTVIYELHVGGFTRHPSARLNAAKRGTFSALKEKIPYLQELGTTAVELLPVFQFDEQEAPAGLKNYWGYNPVSFFALHQGYSSSDTPTAVLDEFRDMVRAFHTAGIEVILDVVYNHSSEGGEGGPTYGFRGIDNSVYYLLDTNNAGYANFSGCGNTLNANHPIVRRMILDSLHFWVTDMHVDGFRFDLASILSRDQHGEPIRNPPVLWDIESDPVFSDTKLIAEAWDAAGLYQVGSFAGDSWREWNGKFRDDVRRFLRGDGGVVSSLVTRLVGSPDIYGHKNREPEQSINFVTCHDGFTLVDLVSYERKHNEANGENNRDGSNDNLSWNCGVEGETDDLQVLAIRRRQIKNFLTITLLSIGAPMISMGDEVCRSQRGNNNGYCQDNEINWFNWDQVREHADIFRFVQLLIRARLLRDLSQPDLSMSLNELLATSSLQWHGIKLNQPDWSDYSHSIAFTVESLGGGMETHFMFNAYHQPLSFELPFLDKSHYWRRWIDTSLDSPNDIFHWGDAPLYEGREYPVPAHTIAILIHLRQADVAR